MNGGKECGSALMVTLLILLVLALLASAMTVWSKNLYNKSRKQVRSSIGWYALESAAAHGVWLLRSDIERFTEKIDIDKVNYNSKERFIADGRPHYFRVAGVDYAFEMKVFDAYSGIQTEHGDANDMFDFVENSTMSILRLERVRTLRNRLIDYIDGDNNIRPNGLERDLYAGLNAPLYPRNAVAIYPEEYSAIPGLLELFPTDAYGRCSYFTPRKLPAGKPNIFAAPRELVYLVADADVNGKKYIEEAFKNVEKKNYTLSFSLSMVDMAMWNRLSDYFSLEESGYYSVLIKPMVESSLRGRSLEVVFFLERGVPSVYSDRFNIISLRFL